MRFRFNDRKTAQMAAHLLKLHGGTMEYIKLIKLMYLADREMLVKHGVPITGDTMVAMRYGPVLSRVYDFINHGDDHQHSEWFKLISPPSNYAVALRPEVAGAPETDELSEYEMDLLKEIHQQYGAVDKWKLVDMLHELPEWKDPGSSMFVIKPLEILLAEDFTEEHIAEVKRAADDLWFLGQKLPAGA